MSRPTYARQPANQQFVSTNRQGIHPEEIKRRTQTRYSDDLLAIQMVRDNPEGLTLQEVGDYFGLTRERVRQIEATACRKLYLAGHALALRNGTQPDCVVNPDNRQVTVEAAQSRYRVWRAAQRKRASHQMLLRLRYQGHDTTEDDGHDE